MKIVKWITLSALTLVMSSAFAHNDDMDAKKMDHYKRHHRMQEILKETIGVIVNLNHTPSAEDKKKLEAMMKELDEMMKDDMPHGHADQHGHGHDDQHGKGHDEKMH